MITRLPAEWEPQSAVLLSWPHENSDWWDPWRDDLNQFFSQLAQAIARFESVIINYYDASHYDVIRNRLVRDAVDLNRIHFCPIKTDDVWARDHGPITVFRQQQPVFLDFIFNGWGNKYPAEQDNQVTAQLCQQDFLQTPHREAINLVLEGGGIESDGQGHLLTTTRFLQHRNPHVQLAQIETQLKQYFGVTKVSQLKHGFIAGDDTEGHIDTLARFVDPQTICYVACDDPKDQHYAELQAMANELRQLTTLDGEAYRLIPLPLPQPINDAEGRCLPATYANFLIVNRGVLLPVYNDPADAIAYERLQNCFPNREIIAIPARAVIQQYGSLHCVTMQLPKGVL